MRSFVTVSLVALALLGCSSPKTAYYKLNSDPIPMMTDASAKIRVMVGPISVPVTMDRPQLVVQTSSNEVQVYEYQRWAGSLKSDIGRVVGSSLARDLATPNVWNFAESTQTNFDYQILLDVQNVESSPDSSIVVDVLWTIKPIGDKNAAVKSRMMMGRSLVREPISGPGLDALVAAQSRAFAKVGSEIAQSVRR